MQQTHRTRVKICGITRVEDALSAAEAGADAIGLVFYAGSKRVVSVAQAKAIVAAVPPFVMVVGLFVNPSMAEVESVLAEVPLDLLQFHGDESPELCASFARPYIKAIRVSPAASIRSAIDEAHYQAARGILFDTDTLDPNQYGGSGKAFDWNRVKQAGSSFRIILAGGLTPANVATAISTVRPWAVDVSSGVEQAPGIKSAALIQSFISEVHRV